MRVCLALTSAKHTDKSVLYYKAFTQCSLLFETALVSCLLLAKPLYKLMLTLIDFYNVSVCACFLQKHELFLPVGEGWVSWICIIAVSLNNHRPLK